jgi:hypothetical protein
VPWHASDGQRIGMQAIDSGSVMKRQLTFFVCGVMGLAICTAAFLAGSHLGSERATSETSTVLVGANALDKRTVLRMLEKNDIDAARKYLNSSIDADILQLHALIQTIPDSDLKFRSQHVLTTIAKDRKATPSESDRSTPEVDEKVKAILNAATDPSSSGGATH